MSKTNLTYVLTFLSGLLLGWLVIGWWLWPVEYMDEVSYQAKFHAQNQIEFREGIPDWLLWPAATIALLGFGAGTWLIGRNRVHTESTIEHSAPVQRYATMTTIDHIPTQYVQSRSLAHARLTFGPTQPTDQHFPIESQQGEPSPGEFGVNQVEDQSAWDVWLFDKQALVTVTKVLADQVDGELASRGEIIPWDNSFGLNTPNLYMTGTAHKVGDRMIVELTVEGKDEN